MFLLPVRFKELRNIFHKIGNNILVMCNVLLKVSYFEKRKDTLDFLNAFVHQIYFVKANSYNFLDAYGTVFAYQRCWAKKSAVEN